MFFLSRRCSSCDGRGYVAEGSEESATRRVVFVVHVSWRRYSVKERHLEYGRLVDRLPVGTAMFVGCTVGKERQGMKSEGDDGEVAGEEERPAVWFDALVVLRGRLARVDEIATWFELKERGAQGWILEAQCDDGKKLEGFVDNAYRKCLLRGETYGTKVKVEVGDEETQEMLDGLLDEERCGEDAVERLTERMRELRKGSEQNGGCLVQ